MTTQSDSKMGSIGIKILKDSQPKFNTHDINMFLSIILYLCLKLTHRYFTDSSIRNVMAEQIAYDVLVKIAALLYGEQSKS